MSIRVPGHLCWPVLRLVNAGHDYARIESTWTLGMVIRANEAMDLQDRVQRKADKRAQSRAERRKGI